MTKLTLLKKLGLYISEDLDEKFFPILYKSKIFKSHLLLNSNSLCILISKHYTYSDTHSILQSLYDKHLISYCRTDSKHIKDSNYNLHIENIKKLSKDFDETNIQMRTQNVKPFSPYQDSYEAITPYYLDSHIQLTIKESNIYNFIKTFYLNSFLQTSSVSESSIA